MLADEFYCTLPDKSFVDRGGSLAYTAIPVKIKNLTALDVSIQVMGDFAIIDGRTSYITPEGERASDRYADCWAKQNGRWLAVSAHVSRKVSNTACSHALVAPSIAVMAAGYTDAWSLRLYRSAAHPYQPVWNKLVFLSSLRTSLSAAGLFLLL